jgi:hypothetical protein
VSAATNDIVRRDQHGVVLRYADPSVLRPHHVERRTHVSDTRRNRLIKAERELLALRIIADHLDLSEIALTRISHSLEAIRLGLEVKRQDYGMPFQAEAAA